MYIQNMSRVHINTMKQINYIYDFSIAEIKSANSIKLNNLRYIWLDIYSFFF